MEITPLGHSCFRMKGRDVSVVTDPFGGEDLRYSPLSASADVVTISHEHPHHAAWPNVGGTPRVFRGPGEYEIRGAMIWGVQTYRRRVEGGPRLRNTSYLFKIEDLSICHLGDLGEPLTAEQLARLKEASVLLVPVGGHCTLDAAEAAEVVARIEPKIVIPMHYGTPATEGTLELDPVTRFCKEMGAADAVPQNRLNVTTSSLPDDVTLVLLEPRRQDPAR
ncbi:MAG: MBL fold metallo-hydrolase [Chloroflexi bacterium]|nr:MBL fold metallo-hydrolase [Chloroflexota bacterium]